MPRAVENGKSQRRKGPQFSIRNGALDADCVACAVYALALAVSIAPWLPPFPAPLNLGVNASFRQIDSGFSQACARRLVWFEFPAYCYVLWLPTALIGTGAIALSIPRVLAMLGACDGFKVLEFALRRCSSTKDPQSDDLGGASRAQ